MSRAAKKAVPSATYVYCLVRSARPPALRGLPRGLPGTGAPRAVDAGGALWLIVGDAPVSRYGRARLTERLRDLGWVSRCAIAHAAVVARSARLGPVVPMRLMTLFTSDDRALAHVRSRRQRIERLLTRVTGRAEWGVQARLDAALAARAARAQGRPTGRLGPGTRFLEARRRARVAALTAAPNARAAAAALYRALARRAEAARRRPVFVGDADAVMLLDAAFLVDVASAARFRREARAHAARALTRGLQVRLTGPWPPYSFVAERL